VAAHLDDAVADLAAGGFRPAAVYVDGAFTSDGIFAPPAAYLQELVQRAQAAGALFVADEVQAGYGRMGDGLWSFEAAGIVPDIVTLGKPMGNGHPVAAVIARSEIVDRFAAETEFFSTFGGNPVACAAAMAVLDVVADEGLTANAAAVGEEVRAAIRAMAARHPAIGDVRGRGLMVGVELVLDRAIGEADAAPVPDRSARAPDPALATRVQNEMRERGVLVGTTARAGNVLKIRPPLVIDRVDAALLLRVLEEALVASGA
jgi:4-aminobutyrate aminotransferase-like enzyme